MMLWCLLLAGSSDAVKVTILEVYPGDKYQNTAISELISLGLKATVGKKNIYRDSGKVVGGQPTDGKDFYSIRFGKHNDFERLEFDIHEWVTDENLVSKGMGPPATKPGIWKED